MELAIVSHRSTAGRCDVGQLTRLSRRLAGYSWDALYGGRRDVSVATELARHLGVDLILTRNVDPARLITENPGGRVLAMCAAVVTRELVATVLAVPRSVVPLPAAWSLTWIRASRSGVRTVSCLNEALYLAQIEARRSGAATDGKAPQLLFESAGSV